MQQPTFVYDTYEVNDGKELLFTYTYLNQDNQILGSFTEKYILPVAIDRSDETTKYILQQLHIIVGISYYKSLLGHIRMPYQLNESESSYWNTVYDNGLGEYAFINNFSEPIRPFTSTIQEGRKTVTLQNQGAILGVGGGKDSIVAGELCKQLKIDAFTMDVATRDHHGQAGAVMDKMGLPQLRVERYIDKNITNFTQLHNGYNGHVPLSAILAWVGLLIAYATNKKYVMMANESSTSSSNTVWQGREVNHQWAKSYEFETLTMTFLRQNISPDIFYFSPIRPYGSLTVMALFAIMGKPYLHDFTSCNLVLRIDPSARPNGRWCTQCAKCLSTWLLLTPWFTISELVSIFGRDLFQDKSLQPLLRELLGLSGHKPLDCVGTVEELRAVTRSALQDYKDENLLQGLAAKDIPGPDIDSLTHAVSASNAPLELKDAIQQAVRQSI